MKSHHCPSIVTETFKTVFLNVIGRTAKLSSYRFIRMCYRGVNEPSGTNEKREFAATYSTVRDGRYDFIISRVKWINCLFRLFGASTTDDVTVQLAEDVCLRFVSRSTRTRKGQKNDRTNSYVGRPPPPFARLLERQTGRIDIDFRIDIDSMSTANRSNRNDFQIDDDFIIMTRAKR